MGGAGRLEVLDGPQEMGRLGLQLVGFLRRVTHHALRAAHQTERERGRGEHQGDADRHTRSHEDEAHDGRPSSGQREAQSQADHCATIPSGATEPSRSTTSRLA
jgi:hypothetical protein